MRANRELSKPRLIDIAWEYGKREIVEAAIEAHRSRVYLSAPDEDESARGEPIAFDDLMHLMLKSSETGFTFSTHKHAISADDTQAVQVLFAAPMKGVAVAIHGTEIWAISLIDANGVADVRKVLAIKKWFDDMSPLFEKGVLWIGGWGTTELNLSLIFRKKRHAKKFGRSGDQISVFDLSRGKELKTGGSGEPGYGKVA